MSLLGPVPGPLHLLFSLFKTLFSRICKGLDPSQPLGLVVLLLLREALPTTHLKLSPAPLPHILISFIVLFTACASLCLCLSLLIVEHKLCDTKTLPCPLQYPWHAEQMLACSGCSSPQINERSSSSGDSAKGQTLDPKGP